jgi:hypothetical protein
MKPQPTPLLVTVENKTTGGKYTYRAKSQKQANAWINWVQEDDPVTLRNCPDCHCRIVITVEEAK